MLEDVELISVDILLQLLNSLRVNSSLIQSIDVSPIFRHFWRMGVRDDLLKFSIIVIILLNVPILTLTFIYLLVFLDLLDFAVLIRVLLLLRYLLVVLLVLDHLVLLVVIFNSFVTLFSFFLYLRNGHRVLLI